MCQLSTGKSAETRNRSLKRQKRNNVDMWLTEETRIGAATCLDHPGDDLVRAPDAIRQNSDALLGDEVYLSLEEYIYDHKRVFSSWE